MRRDVVCVTRGEAVPIARCRRAIRHALTSARYHVTSFAESAFPTRLRSRYARRRSPEKRREKEVRMRTKARDECQRAAMPFACPRLSPVSSSPSRCCYSFMQRVSACARRCCCRAQRAARSTAWRPPASCAYARKTTRDVVARGDARARQMRADKRPCRSAAVDAASSRVRCLPVRRCAQVRFAAACVR